MVKKRMAAMSDEGIIDGFINAHRFTNQTRRELAEWISEIAYREKISVGDVINGKDIQSILQNEKMNAPQKHQKIRDELYKRRFPEFSKLRDNWQKNAASVNPNPSKIQFIPSVGFEKRRLEIKLTIESAGEARSLLESLLEIRADVWDELLWPRSVHTSRTDVGNYPVP